MRVASKLITWTLLATCAAPLSACTFLDSFVPKKGERTDVLDRSKNLTVDDFRNLSEIDKDKKSDEDPKATAALGVPPIPDVAQVLAAPRPPKVANAKLVTLAVTDDVPLRDVLFELGRLANVDIEVGAGLDKTGINLRATDRPFNEVIERIATLGHLRYSVSGNSIRVEKDLPYIKNYSLDFLNFVRSSTSSYSLTTSILASGGSSSSGSSGSSSGSSGGSTAGTVGNSGSSSDIKTTAESDLWASLEASVTEILNYNPEEKSADAAAAAGASAGAAAGAGAGKGSIIINRQAGVLSVNATERQHEMVQNFLNMMSRNASAQVLIEAKVVEVSLLDQFVSGVNWTSLLGNQSGVRATLGSYSGAITNGPSTGSALTLGIDAGDLEAIITATQRFGTTRTLSSPRLSAINNQQAVLTFARNEVFVDCKISQASSSTTSTTGTTTTGPTVDCKETTVPIGVILNILPSVNLDSQEVTLNVRPTLTRIVDKVENPGVAIAAKAVGLSMSGYYPVVEVRELDSVMKVKSGGVMVIGGLMEDASRNSSDGVPGLNELPLVGNLFKGRSEDGFKRELVVFIKATIVNPDGSTHAADRKVYEKFMNDPRPLFPKTQVQ